MEAKKRAKVEIRSESIVIDGYVNVTGRLSRPIPDKKGGYFVEEIAHGTFERALKKADSINVLHNHNWGRNLGSTKSNLQLKEDVIGLRARAEITDPEIVEKAKRKELRGWSFGFTNPTELRAEMENGMTKRTVTDLELKEVSIIDKDMNPWYASTTIEARAGDKGTAEIEVRAEDFEAEYVGLENKKEYDNSKLKQIIEKLGGTV